MIGSFHSRLGFAFCASLRSSPSGLRHRYRHRHWYRWYRSHRSGLSQVTLLSAQRSPVTPDGRAADTGHRNDAHTRVLSLTCQLRAVAAHWSRGAGSASRSRCAVATRWPVQTMVQTEIRVSVRKVQLETHASSAQPTQAIQRSGQRSAATHECTAQSAGAVTYTCL